MAGNIKGITIQFNGDTTKLDKALREVRDSTKDLDRELKDVNKVLKFNPTSVDLWKQKQEILRQKITQTKDNIKQLKDAQAQLDAKNVDKSSQEYRELQREIITAESKLKTFNKQLREIGNANLKALSNQLKEIGSKMTAVGQNMTTKVTAPIVAGYTLAAKNASDYEENLNKIDVAFGENSQAVKDWASTASTEFGLSKVQATDAASAFGALGKGIGLSDAQAADMSTTLAGLSADLGSYFNVGVDESSKALEGIFTGESEALKKFGVVMTDTNLKQFAEDQGLVWSEMDQTQKTMLRYQYVLAKTQDAQGDFARTSDGTANSTKIFQASLQDLGTSIGTNLLPIITPVIQKITEWINKFQELSPETQKIITIVGLVAAAIGPVLMVIGTLISSIGAIAGAIGMVTAPMLGIVAVIAAVIAAFVLWKKHGDKIKKFFADFGEKIAEVWEKIKEDVTNAVEGIKEVVSKVFNLMKTIITTAVNAIKLVITTVFNAIKTFLTTVVQGWKNILTTAWNSIKATASSTWNAIKNAIVTPINAARSTVTSIANNIRSAVTGAFSGLASSVRGAFNNVKNAITQPIQNAFSAVKSAVNKIKGLFPLNIGKVFSGLKLPHFEIISRGKFPWGIAGKGSVPKWDVSWYAKGGIFNSPTIAGIGEIPGGEAVVPLNKFWDRLDNMSTGETNIVININGAGDPRAVAEEVKRMLIRETNQRRLAWQ